MSYDDAASIQGRRVPVGHWVHRRVGNGRRCWPAILVEGVDHALPGVRLVRVRVGYPTRQVCEYVSPAQLECVHDEAPAPAPRTPFVDSTVRYLDPSQAKVSTGRTPRDDAIEFHEWESDAWPRDRVTRPVPHRAPGTAVPRGWGSITGR